MHSTRTKAESRLNLSVSVPPLELDRPSAAINQDIALKLVSWIDDAKTLGRLATVNRSFKAVSKYPLKALRVVRRHTSQASSRALFMLNMHLCMTDIYHPRLHLDGTMRRLKLYMGGELKRLSHRQTAPVGLDAALAMTTDFAHWPELREASFRTLCESAHSGVTSTSADEVERFEASITLMLDNAFSPLCHAAAAARLPELPMQGREPFIVRLLAYLDATVTLSMDELGAIVRGLAGAPFIDEARPDESIALLSRLAERIVRLPLDRLAECTVLLASGLEGLLMTKEATAIVKAIQEHLIDMESRLSRSLSKPEQAIAVGHLGRLQVGMAKSTSRSAVFRRYRKLLTTECGWAGLGTLAAGLLKVPAESQDSQYGWLIARCSKLSPTSALRAHLQIDAVLHGLSYMQGRTWSDLQSIAAHGDPAVFKDAMGWLMKASGSLGFMLQTRTVQLILTQIESGSKGDPFDALANTSKLIRRHLAVEDARPAYRRLLDVAGSVLGRQLGSFYIQESARANAAGIHHAAWATEAIESSISSLSLQNLQFMLDELDDLAQAESIAPNAAYWMFDHIGACLVIAASGRSPTRRTQEIVPLGNQIAKNILKMQIALPRAFQVPPNLFERLMAKDFPADARILRDIALTAVFGESNHATESTLDRCLENQKHLSSMRSFQKNKLFKAVLAAGNLDHANRLVKSVTTWKPDPLDLPELDVDSFVELLIKTRSPIPDSVIKAIDRSFANMQPLAQQMTEFRARLARSLARPHRFSSLPPGSSACLIDHLTQLKSLIGHFIGRGEIEKALLKSYIPKQFREGGKIPQDKRKEMKLITNLLGDFVNERGAVTYLAQDDYFFIWNTINKVGKKARRMF